MATISSHGIVCSSCLFFSLACRSLIIITVFYATGRSRRLTPTRLNLLRFLSLHSFTSTRETRYLLLCVEALLGSAKLFQIIRSVHATLTKAPHLTTSDMLIVRLHRYPGVHRQWCRDANEVRSLSLAFSVGLILPTWWIAC